MKNINNMNWKLNTVLIKKGTGEDFSTAMATQLAYLSTSVEFRNIKLHYQPVVSMAGYIDYTCLIEFEQKVNE